MVRCLAIDPGLTGAIVVVGLGAGRVPTLLAAARMPVRPGAAKRRRVDVSQLLRTVRDLGAADGGVGMAILEMPSAMPRQGVSSSFGFGWTCGACEAAILSLGVPVELVAPVVWKRAMRCPADKGGARARASEMFPSSVDAWSMAKDDGLAEAALLGLYGLTIGWRLPLSRVEVEVEVEVEREGGLF